jgi:hypothetical protein
MTKPSPTKTADQIVRRVAAQHLAQQLRGSESPETFYLSGDRNQQRKVVLEAFVKYMGSEFPTAQKLLKTIALFLSKVREFDGYKFVADKGEVITMGDHTRWEGSVGGRGPHGTGAPVFKLTLDCQTEGRGYDKPGAFGTMTFGLSKPKFTLGLWKLFAVPTAVVVMDSFPTIQHAKALLEKYGVARMLKDLGGPVKGRFQGLPTLEDVERFLRGKLGWFKMERKGKNSIAYTTRENGFDGEAGQEDIDLAHFLDKSLSEEFGISLIVHVDVTDEEVSLTVFTRD